MAKSSTNVPELNGTTAPFAKVVSKFESFGKIFTVVGILATTAVGAWTWVGDHTQILVPRRTMVFDTSDADGTFAESKLKIFRFELENYGIADIADARIVFEDPEIAKVFIDPLHTGFVHDSTTQNKKQRYVSTNERSEKGSLLKSGASLIIQLSAPNTEWKPKYVAYKIDGAQAVEFPEKNTSEKGRSWNWPAWIAVAIILSLLLATWLWRSSVLKRSEEYAQEIIDVERSKIVHETRVATAKTLSASGHTTLKEEELLNVLTEQKPEAC